ncbi:MAG: 6-bladed beta-propeller [Terriglobia bacterium]
MTCWRLLAMLGVLLALCLAAGLPASARKKAPPAKALTLVWPLPPEQPRIKFVRAIYGAADIMPAKKVSLLDRVSGIKKSDFKAGFVKPYDIATDSHDRIYVTDSGQGLVFVLDPANKEVSFLGNGSQAQLSVPLGITIDSRDRIWVADAVKQHVYVFQPDGTALMALGKVGEMVNPTSVALDEARHRLYVVDSRAHTILVYDQESGQFVTKFGQRGQGHGEFNFPTNVVVDRAGRIYITDTLNCRVEIFGPDYKFLDAFGSQGNGFGNFLKPKGLALDSYQNLYVVDSDFDNFQIFDPNKRLLMFLGGGGVQPGTFWLPAGIYVDRHNQIYVADQNNRRIQIFQLLNGETVEPAPSGPNASRNQAQGKGGTTRVAN